MTHVYNILSIVSVTKLLQMLVMDHAALLGSKIFLSFLSKGNIKTSQRRYILSLHLEFEESIHMTCTALTVIGKKKKAFLFY